MMWVLDANIFLRVLVKEEKQTHEESKRVLQMVQAGDVEGVVSGLVLAEIVWVLLSVYRVEKPRVVEMINGILLLPGLRVVHEYDQAWALEMYARNSVKYIDACVAAMPQVRRGEAVVVSYDRDFSLLECEWKLPSMLV